MSNQYTDKLWHDNTFGLEIEQHRVNEDERLSRDPYPAEFGTRRTHPYLQTDFTDSMMELVTEPAHSAADAVRNMQFLQQIVHDHLQKDERIWPLSMPPKLIDDDLAFAHEDFTRYWYQEYRDHLEQKYGIEHEIICGIHINFSLNPDLIETLFEDSDENDEITFKNQLYFRMAQWFVLYRWLFTYLYGATPLSENRYSRIPADLKMPVWSLRNSTHGYSNKVTEVITYRSLERQVAQITDYVQRGIFHTQHEFYGPVRMKGVGEGLDTLISHGIEYLEFRSFDLNPFTLSGISETKLDLMELFMTYAALNDLPSNFEDRLEKSLQQNEEVAMGDPTDKPDWLAEACVEFVAKLQTFIDQTQAPERYQTALDSVSDAVDDINLTVGARLAREIKNDSLVSFSRTIGETRLAFYENAEKLEWLGDQVSADAKNLIYVAIVAGIRIQPFEQELKFTHGEDVELIPLDFKLAELSANEYLSNLFPGLADKK